MTKAPGRLSVLLPLLAALVAMPQAPAAAQEYPSRQVTILLGLAPGGGADVLTRYFASKLTEATKQQFIVENKPGALGNIAAETVARARPDGYTLLIGPNTSFSANVHLFKKLNFDPVKDFAPVALLLRLPFVLVVNPQKTPATSLAELTQHIRQRGNIKFGSPTGTSLAASELYKSLAGVDALQVPYRTMQQAFADLIGSEIDFLFADATFVMEQVKSGKARALAVTTDRRAGAIPELPTMMEAGLPGFGEITAWFAMAAPAGTPAPVVNRLNAALNQILGTDETKKFLHNIYADATGGTPQAMVEFQAREIAKWGRLVALAKIEPQ